MRRFFLDLEFTNGNYYLAEIIEMALVSEISGFSFHTHVKIDNLLAPFVKKLTGITDKTLQDIGLPFPIAFREMVKFIGNESDDDDESPIIIAHGGVLHDFPILLTNCMRHNVDYSMLERCRFIDSMERLKRHGYAKPGLQTFRCTGDKKHCAYDDARVLEFLCRLNYRLIYEPPYLTFTDVLQHLETKMPISITSLVRLARDITSLTDFVCLLRNRSLRNTALNPKQIVNIANFYFKKF